MKKTIDLNCDMGEGFGHWSYGDAPDEELMKLISSANVATGFHAGDPNLMNRTVILAKEHGVELGAHPGYRDLQGFGRRTINATDQELVNDIIYQLGAMREFCSRHNVKLQHVKPHGALYMDVAKNRSLSKLLVEAVRQCDPDLFIFCMDISETYKEAKNQNQPVVMEFYADRDYDDSGSIVFQRKVDRLDPIKVANKCLRACKEGVVKTISGNEISINFDSICFHSDTPGALEIGKAIRNILEDNEIKLSSAKSIMV